MLMTRGISFFLRESRFWGNVLPEEEAVDRVSPIGASCEPKFNTELAEIIPDNAGRVASVRTRKVKKFSANLLATIRPTIDFLQKQIYRQIKVF